MINLFKYDEFIKEGNRLGDFMDSSKPRFSNDEPFIKRVILDEERVIKIQYYHTENHDLIKRIQERTTLTCVSDFNKCIEGAIKQIKPSRDNKMRSFKKYNLHFIHNNFNVVFLINSRNFKNIEIVTILKSIKDLGAIRSFEINDENFLNENINFDQNELINEKKSKKRNITKEILKGLSKMKRAERLASGASHVTRVVKSRKVYNRKKKHK
jgi:hypothetical protein